MVDFAYVNTRLRAMSAGLLAAPAVTELAENTTLSGFLNELGRTAYQPALAAARARFSDQLALSQALQNDQTATVNHIKAFCHHGDVAPELTLIWTRYDVHNVIALERGLQGRLAPEAIMSALVGGGRLPLAALRRLAETGSARAARDLLATWGEPIAAPLLALGARAASLAAVEMALAQWYFHQRTAPAQPAILAELARREADMANVMTVLRRLASGIGAPPRETWPELFIGPGRLTWARLAAFNQLPDVVSAIVALNESVVGRPLAVQPADPQGRRLSHFAAQLHRAHLAWLRRARLQDPFGPGILLAYLAHKENEIGNLRRIGAGLWLGETTAAIQAELILV